jgi:hypothetical protein
MLVALQLVGAATVPLKVSVLVPWVVPKLFPTTVTDVPTTPEPGERLSICGDTVKVTPLLGDPPTVITTGPDVAPAGTGATTLVALQPEGIATVPLNVTVLVP